MNEKYIDDKLDKNTILRFNQTLEICLKVSVGNDRYNLTKYNKIQITDTTIIKSPNNGGYLLQNWNMKCNDRNGNGKISNFVETTKTHSPSSRSGATSVPPIGDSFTNIETSSNNHGNNVFVSFERTDIIQSTNITFYYNRFSILTDCNFKNKGRFRIQFLLDDNTWSIRYTIAKNTHNSDNSTDWTLLNLIFTIESNGKNLILDEIGTAPSDMFFSNITITHGVY